MQPIVEFRGVSKRFGALDALQDVSFFIPQGRIVGLLGPNGSGKSTCLKLLNGLLQADHGLIQVHGQPLGIASKSVISYLPERTYLNQWMKVRQLISFFSDFYADFEVHRAYEMLERLRIEPDASLKTLSKGTQEKVQLILVMSRKADLYLLDEPIGGVDPAARDYILETILSNYRQEASLLISTHLIADVERLFDEVIFLKEGSVYRQDSVDTLRQETGQSIDQIFREVFRC